MRRIHRCIVTAGSSPRGLRFRDVVTDGAGSSMVGMALGFAEIRTRCTYSREWIDATTVVLTRAPRWQVGISRNFMALEIPRPSTTPLTPTTHGSTSTRHSAPRSSRSLTASSPYAATFRSAAREILFRPPLLPISAARSSTSKESSLGWAPPSGPSEGSGPGWTQSQPSYGLVRSRSSIFFSASLMATASGLHLAKFCNSWVTLATSDPSWPRT